MMKMKGSLRSLVISMVLLLLLYPFLIGGVVQRTAMNIIMSAIFFFGISTVSFNRRNMTIGLSIGVPWFLLTWIEMITPDPPLFLSLAATLLLIPFYVLIVVVIFSFVLKSKEVTENVLYGAVAIYMLIGGLWMSIYVLIETLHPGSFMYAALGPGNPVEWMDLLYYSFATLTTLGYGDIVPVSLPAKHFAVTQAIIGVMYLAIIISRLIGLFIGQARASGREL
jgi:hypothetical protein